MCGRGALTTKREDLMEALGLDEAPELPPRYNVAPTQPIAVVRDPGKLELLRWGLLPHDGPRLPGGGINARVETVARAPAYRAAFRSRRCLVILSAFYEWRRVSKKLRQPFLIQRHDHQPLTLAGIWDRTVTADGEVVESAAIITGPAVGIVAELHNRMPLVVLPEQIASWLDPTTHEPIKLLLGNAVELEAYPVRPLVNSPANEGPELIEPDPNPGIGQTGNLF